MHQLPMQLHWRSKPTLGNKSTCHKSILTRPNEIRHTLDTKLRCNNVQCQDATIERLANPIWPIKKSIAKPNAN